MLQPQNYMPGVVLDDTEYSSQGYAIGADKIRFVRGKVESMPGYVDYLPGERISGICRGMHSWFDLRSFRYLALGTNSKLYAIQDGALFDITPISGNSTGEANSDGSSTTVNIEDTDHGLRDGDTVYLYAPSSPFGYEGTLPSASAFTNAGSTQVVITLSNHGFESGQRITISNATPFNGVDMNGTWTLYVNDQDTFSIYADDEATGSGSGGGTPDYEVAVPYVASYVDEDNFTVEISSPTVVSALAIDITYELGVGRIDGTGPGGYSYNGYGTGPYGFTPDPKNKADFLPRTWALDNYGSFLVANPLGGGIYMWRLNPSKRAEIIAGAPTQCDYMTVTSEGAIMAFGCTNTDGDYDPLIIRWSDTRNGAGTPFETWTPAPTNLSGEDRLTVGSNIVGARKTKVGVAVWTDISLHFGQFVSSVDVVYSFQHISSGCGLAGPNASVEKDGTLYWFNSAVGFYVYQSGSPTSLPCPMVKYVVDNIPEWQGYKIYAAYDAVYDSVLWFYPSARNNPANREVNEYVRLDTREIADQNSGWSPGTTDMTAWLDRNPLEKPFSVRIDGMVCQQDTGRSAAGMPMYRYIEYAPIEINTGEFPFGSYVINVNKVVFDALSEGEVNLYMRFRRWPNDKLVEKGPYPQDKNVKFKSIRGQGRQAGFLWESTGAEDSWRFGLIRFDVSPGPRR